MKSSEIKASVKALYLVVTADIVVYPEKQSQVLGDADKCLSRHIGSYLNNEDMLYARDQMSNSELITILKALSTDSKSLITSLLSDLKSVSITPKGRTYCDELTRVILERKIDSSMPQLTLLLKMEERSNLW